MSKLNAIFPNWFSGGGIFSAMNAPPWEGSISSLELDIEYFTNQSGEKQPSSLVKKFIVDGEVPQENVEKIATLLQNRFNRNWGKLWETLTLEYNPISNYDMKETESVENTEQRTSDGNNSSNGSTNISRYAFNTSTPSPYDKTEMDSNGEYADNMESSGTIKRTLSRTGNIGVTTSQQMIEAQRNLWVWDFFKVVFKDVDSVLTIPVFQLDACKHNAEEFNCGGGENKYTLPVATSEALGGIKADPKTANETVPVKIGTDNKLYIPQGADDYTLPVATSTELGGIKAEPKTANETVPVKIGTDNKLYVPQGADDYTLPVATSTELGGIKADPKTANETVPVKIGDDGKLYVPQSQGGSGENEYTLPVATSTELGGIKAEPKTANETVEVKIGDDGKLYVPQSQGGGNTSSNTFIIDAMQISTELSKEFGDSICNAITNNYDIVLSTAMDMGSFGVYVSIKPFQTSCSTEDGIFIQFSLYFVDENSGVAKEEYSLDSESNTWKKIIE